MDKIVFDSFKPTGACYEKFPTDPTKKDECTVEVAIHEKDKPKSPDMTLHFYRDKTRYLLDPQDAPKSPRLIEMGFKEGDPSLQTTIGLAVELNYSLKVTVFSQKAGTDAKVTTAALDMVNFLAGGNLEKPDAEQRKAMGLLLLEVLTLPSGSRDLLQKYLQSLKESQWMPDSVRPRADWLIDVIKFQKEIEVSVAGLDEKDPLFENLKILSVNALIHLHTDQATFKETKENLDHLAKELAKTKTVKSPPKDFYALMLTRFEGLSKNSFFTQNLEGRKRLNVLLGHLRTAVQSHRAELVIMEPDLALRHYLTYEILEASKTSSLARRVLTEMDESGVSEEWIQKHAKQIAQTVLPHFSLTPGLGKIPYVKVDVKALETDLKGLINKNPDQETEYKVASLAVLRYLFGKSLNETKLSGWALNQEMALEFKLEEADYQRLRTLGLSLGPSGKKKTNITRDIIFPIGHGTVMAGGIGLFAYGLAEKDRYPMPGNPYYHTGAGLMGFGAGALTCNLAWKQKNAGLQFLTDTLCGVIVGGATTGLSFAVQGLDSKGTGSGSSKEDGRNPVTPYGP